MQFPSTVDVLVVGAGPTGLSVAISAILAGCGDILVVDSLERGQNSSRATVVHALTLEVLERIGVTPALAQAGNKSSTTIFYSGDRTLLEVPFGKVHPKYNYMLTLPQSQTEQILADRLKEVGGKVHYKQKIVAVRDVEEELKTVVFSDGQVIKARYVIGADGLNSVVREQAGIAYVDPVPGRPDDFWVGQMCLADVHFASPPPPSANQLFRACLSTRGILGMIPLPDGRFRIFAGVPKNAVIPQHPDIDYIRKILKDRGVDKEIKSVEWSSRFRVRSRLAESFYVPAKNGKGAVILAGDAAHTHSPAGGQGMNLGLIDGVYLAQALRAHMDTGKDEFLANYSRERKARAGDVIAAAERISSTGERLLTWQAVWIKWAAWLLNMFPSITSKIALSMSGMNAAQSNF